MPTLLAQVWTDISEFQTFSPGRSAVGHWTPSVPSVADSAYPGSRVETMIPMDILEHGCQYIWIWKRNAIVYK